MVSLSFSSSSRVSFSLREEGKRTTTATSRNNKNAPVFWRQNRRLNRCYCFKEEEEKKTKYEPPSLIVVVEGVNDAKRVRKALNVAHPNAVFAMRGSYFDVKANKWKIQPNIVRAVERNAGWLKEEEEERGSDGERRGIVEAEEVIVFTDPDVAGRQYRQNFIQYLPRAKHAFVSRYRARCKKKTKWHEVNDCGVEFATDGAIRVAVKEARAPRTIKATTSGSRSETTTATATTTEGLLEWMTVDDMERRGLKGTTKAGVLGVSSKRLRQVLGNVLGIGDCDAKQMQRQLNMFFSSEEFERAMETSLELLESGEADACDFHDVNGDDALESNEENEDGFEEDFGFDANAYIPPGQAPPGFE